MKSLSIRQPWAWLIVHGYQDIENRSWPTKYRGPILIHAGKTVDPDIDEGRKWIESKLGIIVPKNLDLGGIVGQAEIVDCISKSESPWFDGPFGFVIKNSQPLEFRPCKGKLGLFQVDF